MNDFYKLNAELPSGEVVSMEQYKGKVVLITNTASKCGLTYQYTGLEELYKKYKDQGLVILGFPCNQFANQEPGSDEEIKSACLLNYGVTFPVFKKVDVNGEFTHEVFNYLKNNSFTFFGKKIKWNFSKFLVNKDGTKIKRFAPVTKPEKLEKYILELLQK